LLQEAGLLPLGAPGVAPQLSESNFVSLFLALAANTTRYGAAQAVRALLETTPAAAGASTPADVGSAETAMLDLVRSAREFPDDLSGVAIEVVGSWPELALHQFGKVQTRYQPAGSLREHWQSRGHRCSTIVPGGAFRDAVRSTFKKD
jgi:hypothetical protein